MKSGEFHDNYSASDGRLNYDISNALRPHNWNPSGKKKGTNSLKTSLEKALSQPITVTVDGRSKVVSACDALSVWYVDSGFKGEIRDIDAIFDRIERMIGGGQGKHFLRASCHVLAGGKRSGSHWWEGGDAP
jgi:hypothetical protein